MGTSVIMDTLVKELITTGGNLGVLVFIVIVFLRDRRTALEENRAFMERLHSDHIDQRALSRECIAQNTKAMMENTVVVEHLSSAISNCGFKQHS